MFKWLFSKFKKVEATSGYDVLDRAGDDDNWDMVTRLNATALDDRETRQKLRDVARFEMRNNPHLRGLSKKATNEIVGTGPRIGIIPMTPSDRSLRAADRLERIWKDYAAQIGFTDILRMFIDERRTGGEAFGVVTPNPEYDIPRTITVYEADQFQSPDFGYTVPQFQTPDGIVDGIRYDRFGNPTTYYRRVVHPYGDTYQFQDRSIPIDASVVFHWFNRERPSQHRGVSELAPTLEIYSRLRRFIESKVQQEELRAKMLGVIKTAFPPDQCVPLGGKRRDIWIGEGQFTTLPDGWDAQLFKLDVTGQGVAEFVRTCLTWATQTLLTPWNISWESSDYNFASGRLDYMLFYNHIRLERESIERKILNRYFWDHWYPYASLTRMTPSDLGQFKVKWFWDQRQPIDEKKQADATVTLKTDDLLDETKYWADQGENVHDVDERRLRLQFRRELLKQKLSEEYGVTLDEQSQQPTQTVEDDTQERA